MRLTAIHAWGISGPSGSGGYSGGSVGGGTSGGPGGSTGTGQDAKDRARTRAGGSAHRSKPAIAAPRSRPAQAPREPVVQDAARVAAALGGGTSWGGRPSSPGAGGGRSAAATDAATPSYGRTQGAGFGLSERDRETRRAAGLVDKSWEHMTTMEKTMTSAKTALGAINPVGGLLTGLRGFASSFLGPITKEVTKDFKQSLADNKQFGWSPFDKEGFARRMADPEARGRYEAMQASARSWAEGAADRQGGGEPARRRIAAMGAPAAPMAGAGVTGPTGDVGRAIEQDLSFEGVLPVAGAGTSADWMRRLRQANAGLLART